MKNNENIIVLCLLFLITGNFYAQDQHKVDSLQVLLEQQPSDQERMGILHSLSKTYRTYDNNKAIQYGKESLVLAEKLNDRSEQAQILNTIGWSYLNQDNYPETFKNLNSALQISTAIKYSKGITDAYWGIGHAYLGQNNYAEALNNYYEVLKLAEEEEDLSTANSARNMIEGILVTDKKTPEQLREEAKQYFEVLEKGGNNQELHRAYQHLSGIHHALGDLEASLKYGLQALDIARAINGVNEITNSLNIIAEVHIYEKNHTEALVYLSECLTLAKEKDLKQMEMNAARKIGIILSELGNYLESKDNFNRSLSIAYEISNLSGMSSAHYQLSELEGTQGNFKPSLENFKQHINYRDSIFNLENTRKILKEEFQYKTEKAVATEKAEREKRNAQFVSIAIISLLLLLYLYNRIKNQIQQRKLTVQVEEQTKEIIQQKEKLEELDILKSRLYTNITHEFRTPLTVISGIADHMQSDTLEEDKQIIKRNSHQLLNLVNQMLELRKLESGAIRIQKTQTDIIKFLRYLTASLKSYAETKDLTLHFLSDEVHILMDYDAEKITRIHTNLLSNAIKFTPLGGDVYIQLQIEEQKGGRNFVMKVKDTGVGIPSDQLPHIFERFYQVDSSLTRKGEGTGIGLTLVSELIKAMNGEIKVSSVIGEGTTFIVFLPITNMAEMTDDTSFEKKSNRLMIGVAKPLPIASEVLEGLDHSTQKPLALIVEDNADVIHYLIACLKDDYTIEIAMNGEEGIEKAIIQTPDIIISDVMMPIKDGFELCQSLKTDERSSHIPIILLTAKADIESRLEGLQRGADAYLSKPFQQKELLIILQNQLELRKTLQTRFLQFSKETLAEVETTILDQEVVQEHLKIEDVFLQKIRILIERDLSDSEVGMPQLIRGLGMSRSQIYKKVKALTGFSPSRYMRSIRLHHAQKMLQTTDLNVSEVAYEAGFSSPVYFSDVFLEEFGIRPNDTRK